MARAQGANRIAELEREILRLMCSGSSTPAQTEGARQELREHVWRIEEHRVVFEALGRVRSGDIVPLRQQLPAHATRMGFPDVDWNLYFNSAADQRASRKGDLPEAVRELLLKTNLC